MNFLISTNIIFMVILVVLILIVAYKVLVKKSRPKNLYTPFDYITGQSDEEFHKEEEQGDEIGN